MTYLRLSAKRIVLAIALFKFLFLLTVSCRAQDVGSNSSQPHFSGQAPGERQAILRRVKGTVTAIDSKRMTMTIKSAEGERAIKITSKTKFNRNGVPASMKDVAVGNSLEAVVKMVYGQPDELAKVDITAP